MSIDAPSQRAQALRTEQRLLRLSTFSAAGFAVVAVIWGILAGSQVILLDGMYAVVGVVLGGLSLRAAILVQRGPTAHYPFGREALAPVVVAVQGLVLLGSLIYAVIDAISVISNGGSETSFGAALLYALASTAAGALVWQILRRRGSDSELVAAEAAQWYAGILLSVGMFLGFGVALLLQSTQWADVVPFIDPVMVIVAAFAIAPTPLGMLRQTYHELLEGVAPPEVAGPARAAVLEISAEYGLPEPSIRMGKLGRKLYVEVDYLVGEGDGWTISDADNVRRIILGRLREPGRSLWINVELHTDPNWDAD